MAGRSQRQTCHRDASVALHKDRDLLWMPTGGDSQHASRRILSCSFRSRCQVLAQLKQRRPRPYARNAVCTRVAWLQPSRWATSTAFGAGPPKKIAAAGRRTARWHRRRNANPTQPGSTAATITRSNLLRQGSCCPVGPHTFGEVQLGVRGYPRLLVFGLDALEIRPGRLHADAKVPGGGAQSPARSVGHQHGVLSFGQERAYWVALWLSRPGSSTGPHHSARDDATQRARKGRKVVVAG